MMAGRIRDEDIAAVRERSPIDEVVGEYLQLKNAGGGRPATPSCRKCWFNSKPEIAASPA